MCGLKWCGLKLSFALANVNPSSPAFPNILSFVDLRGRQNQTFGNKTTLQQLSTLYGRNHSTAETPPG